MISAKKLIDNAEYISQNRKPEVSNDPGADDDFRPTKQIGALLFDEVHKKWAIQSRVSTGFMKSKIVQNRFDYSDILEVTLLEDGVNITNGGTNMSREKCSDLELKITFKTVSYPVVYVDFIKGSTDKSSTYYSGKLKEAQEALSVFQIILRNRGNTVGQTQNSAASDPYTEVKKLKELLDMGIITQTEFETKKKELLGL